MRRVLAIVAGVAIVSPTASLHGQPAPAHSAHADTRSPTDAAAEAAFISAVRAGTLRYRDLAAARVDGYRPLGGDLPSLGEHWVHNRRALADTLDPAAPPILVYVRVAGNPVLAGVAFTRFLASGEQAPSFPRSHPHAWHEHNGGVEDEVLPLAHHAAAREPGASTNAGSARLRIAVMHAWIAIENPAGMWASENWGLPYVRLGLAPTAGDGGLGARVMSLAAGADYYLRAMVSAGGLDDTETVRVERILRDFSARAALFATRQRDSVRGESPTELWSGFWGATIAAVRPEAARRLAELRDSLTGDAR